MALRIARGVFRLWIVLSVLWISGAAIVIWWVFQGKLLFGMRQRWTFDQVNASGKVMPTAFIFWIDLGEIRLKLF